MRLAAFYKCCTFTLFYAVRDVRFQCQVTAEPEPSLTWFYNDQPLMSTAHIQLTFDKTATTLTILGATLQDTGDYTCRATNSLGEATTKTFLRVKRAYTCFPNYLQPTCTLQCCLRRINGLRMKNCPRQQE